MAVSWPEGLPFFRVASGQHTLTGSNVVRTQPSLGPVKTRRRSTVAVNVFDGEMPPVSQALAAQVRSFFRSSLADGALPFEARHPYTGLTRTFTFGEGGISERGEGTKRIFTAVLEVIE